MTRGAAARGAAMFVVILAGAGCAEGAGAGSGRTAGDGLLVRLQAAERLRVRMSARFMTLREGLARPGRPGHVRRTTASGASRLTKRSAASPTRAASRPSKVTRTA